MLGGLPTWHGSDKTHVILFCLVWGELERQIVIGGMVVLVGKRKHGVGFDFWESKNGKRGVRVLCFLLI